MKLLPKLLIGVAMSATVTFASASAGCLDRERLTGVNVAGAEFNSSKLPGVVNKDYTYPRDSDLQFMAERGANVIRLPFRWERAQHQLGGPLDAAELKRLQSTVAAAEKLDLCIILDAHNYAKYFGENMAGRTDLHEGLVDFWLKMAKEFPDQTTVAFGLMNEPNYMPLAEWAPLAKRILAELRQAGARNMILIGGGGWSGLHSWFNERDGLSNATAFADVHDPLKATILEVHQYADSDYSGTKSECREADHFDPRFARIGEWARTHNQQLFLGEFGVPNNPVCLQALERMLSLTAGPEWKGWTYWAAGRWWGNYALALNTSTTEPSAQWEIIIPHFYRGEKNEDADNPPKAPANPRYR
jgi:endoglucanase